MITIELKDSIYTDYSGYKRLIDFYHEANKYKNQTIHICIAKLDWIDANLSALLDAILYKLSKENQLCFTIDFEKAKTKFDVLLRNGFVKTNSPIIDSQRSTLPNMHFEIADSNTYIKYLEQWLLHHRGFPEKYAALKDSLIEHLIEVFCNSHYHAGSDYPFFVSGQFFPRQKCLIFTMVDLGEGFLPKISQVEPTIQNSVEAIQWAIKKGNSTKQKMEQIPGGLGISGLLKYCSEANGGIQIVTGDGFWNSEDSTSIFAKGRKINKPFVGTTVNLFFRS